MGEMTGYNLKRLLLDIVYPNQCPFCKEVIPHHQFYCPDCPATLPLIGLTPQSGSPLQVIANIAGTFAVFEYSDVSSPFVFAIKREGDGYAVSAAAKLLSELIAETPIELITCIPTDSAGMRERGDNPPALIARELAAIAGLPSDTRLLRKIRRTKIQKDLSEAQRHSNLKGAFAVNKKRSVVDGKTILLVDDVRTTGATLSTAADVLLAAGAKRVYGAVVAVTLKR